MFKQMLVSVAALFILACGGGSTAPENKVTPPPVVVTNVTLSYLDADKNQCPIPVASTKKTTDPYLTPKWDQWSSYSGYPPPTNGWWDIYIEHDTKMNRHYESNMAYYTFTNNSTSAIRVVDLHGIFFDEALNQVQILPGTSDGSLSVLGVEHIVPDNLLYYIDCYFILMLEDSKATWDPSLPVPDENGNIYICVRVKEIGH